MTRFPASERRMGCDTYRSTMGGVSEGEAESLHVAPSCGSAPALSERGRSLLPASEAPSARALTIADTLTLHDGELDFAWAWSPEPAGRPEPPAGLLPSPWDDPSFSLSNPDPEDSQ